MVSSLRAVFLLAISMALLTITPAFDDVKVNLKEFSRDNKIHFIEFPRQNSSNGLGEDWHPSVKTQEVMANQLAGK
ncbi:hypothetical protein ACN077_08925 [Clostridium chromiireducens]